MPLPQIPPGEGDQPAGEHFRYQPTPAGGKWHGYLAGPALWFMCHQPKKTKPCVAILTGGAVECPWCGTDKELVRRGYLPLYRQADLKPCCVILSDLYEETVAKFELHTRVLLGKEDDKSDPVWIMKAITAAPVFQTTLRRRWKPADVSETCLKLWGCPELTAWYRKHAGKSDNAVSLPRGTAVHADGSPVSPALQAAAKRQGFHVIPPAGGEDDAAQVERDRQLLAAVQRGEKPGKNGNGKHRLPPKG